MGRTENPFTVRRAGVDTVSFAWRLPDDDALWSRLRLATERESIDGEWPIAPGRLPEMWQLAEPLGGGRWFFMFDHRLIYVEGRLQSLLGDAEPERRAALADNRARGSREGN